MIAAIILCEEANRKLFFFSSFQADTFCPIPDFRGSQHFDKNILLGKNCFDRCKMTNWACRELFFFCLPPVNISASWLSGAVNFRSFLRVWLWKLICAVEMPSCQNRTVLGWQAYLSSWRVGMQPRTPWWIVGQKAVAVVWENLSLHQQLCITPSTPSFLLNLFVLLIRWLSHLTSSPHPEKNQKQHRLVSYSRHFLLFSLLSLSLHRFTFSSLPALKAIKGLWSFLSTSPRLPVLKWILKSSPDSPFCPEH